MNSHWVYTNSVIFINIANGSLCKENLYGVIFIIEEITFLEEEEKKKKPVVVEVQKTVEENNPLDIMLCSEEQENPENSKNISSFKNEIVDEKVKVKVISKGKAGRSKVKGRIKGKVRNVNDSEDEEVHKKIEKDSEEEDESNNDEDNIENEEKADNDKDIKENINVILKVDQQNTIKEEEKEKEKENENLKS